MDLVPVGTDASGQRRLTISPEARALMNIETAPVERRFATAEVRMVGKVAYDETRLKYITAWVPGRLDRLYVDVTGVEVKQGDHMVYLYSETLYTEQEVLIQALRARQKARSTTRYTSPVDLVESAREKLRLLGLADEQIQEIEKRGTPSSHVTIYAPIGGIVVHKNVNEGERVEVGTRIYTIADLSEVWVKFDAYESDIPWLRYGQQVTFTTEAYPGEQFAGKIAFIDPMLDPETRTVKVRINVANPQLKLKPDMFVRGVARTEIAAGGRVMAPELQGKWISPMHPEVIKDAPGFCDVCGMPLVRAESLGYVSAVAETSAKPLVIPASAALVTGTRAVVYVEMPDTEQPTYEGREIVLGPRAGDYYLVKSGLGEGELVVTQGNFKIDSQVQISAKRSMMSPEGGGPAGAHHHGEMAAKSAPGGPSQVQVPLRVSSQLNELVGSYDQISSAVNARDLAYIRRLFESFEGKVRAVDEQDLSGHPKMLWEELGMLLRNDAVEGRDIRELGDAKRVLGSLTDHLQQVRDQFGLSHEGSPMAEQLLAPAEFQDQLGRMWGAYVELQAALAADDLGAAQRGVKKLASTLSATDMKLLEGKPHAIWMQERANLDGIVDQLAKGGALTALRADFSLLSEEMTAVVRTFGIGASGPVYRLHCPMAFEGHGASWLQPDRPARNPYYGASMLTCADRVELVYGEEGEGHEEGHQH
jgi:Cu(I)/Ag(I) efflux system membrane fusion protein